MAANLLEALATVLENDLVITSIATGGIWADQTPDISTAVPPYLVVSEPDTRTQGALGSKWVEYRTVSFEVPNATKDSAALARDQIRDRLMAPCAPLYWLGGCSTGRYLNEGQTCELYEGLGLNGQDVWIAAFSLTFICGRG